MYMSDKLKKSLKAEVKPFTILNETETLLKSLGLFPLPENIEAYISEDKKYLNLRLKSVNNINHILFQLPLEEKDLSYLKSHPNYDELLERYTLYTTEYMHEIKNYALQERIYLQEHFPGLIFNIKIRLKSYDSYINKLNTNIKDGKSPFINDIMAERIILSEYKDSKDENLLICLCNEVARALYDFRINTNFRMKPESFMSEKEYVSKDYIEKPKENGYQALHILMQNKYNHDFTYETQIKTFEMEHISKTCSEIAHNKYKPRVLNDLAATKVPLYTVITQFNDSVGNPIILDADFEERFYHFYNTSLNNHQEDAEYRSIPISYENYKRELHEIENLLGFSLKEIREKIKNTMDIKKTDNIR